MHLPVSTQTKTPGSRLAARGNLVSQFEFRPFPPFPQFLFGMSRGPELRTESVKVA